MRHTAIGEKKMHKTTGKDFCVGFNANMYPKLSKCQVKCIEEK